MTETELQRKADQLVQYEVYFNMSHWMAFAQAVHGQLGHEPIALHGGPMHSPDCPVDVEEIPYSEECEECKGTGYDPSGDGTDACNECDDGTRDIEIFEWWAISKALANQLAARGEVILEKEYWGRQTTGQGISSDGVIREIVSEIHKSVGP